MLRFDKSPYYEYKRLVFFKGNKKSNETLYMYDESFYLFNRENLASNLIEFEDNDDLDLLNNKEISEFIDDLDKISKKQYLNVVLIELVDNIATDLEIEYDEKNDDTDLYEDLADISLTKHGRFSLSFKKIKMRDSKIKGLDSKRDRYFVLKISQAFFDKHKGELSLKYHESFKPDRYVDTSLAVFLFVVTLPGSAEDHAEEDNKK